MMKEFNKHTSYLGGSFLLSPMSNTRKQDLLPQIRNTLLQVVQPAHASS